VAVASFGPSVPSLSSSQSLLSWHSPC
jgi:hypothetical protein